MSHIIPLPSRPAKCDSAICASTSSAPFGLTFGGTLITLVIVAADAVAAVVVEGDEAELDAAAADALGAAEAHAAPPHC